MACSTSTNRAVPATDPMRDDILRLFNAFAIERQYVLPPLDAFATEVCAHYRADVPYHNLRHAVQVLRLAWTLLRALPPFLTLHEEFFLLLAALMHDLDHPGTTNDWERVRRTPRARACPAPLTCLLEHYHCQLATALVQSHCLYVNLSGEETDGCLNLLRTCIYSTEMARHADLCLFLSSLPPQQTQQPQPTLSHPQSQPQSQPLSPQQRRTLAAALLHAADLGNPTLPWDECLAWAKKVHAEHRRLLRLSEENAEETTEEDTRHLYATEARYIRHWCLPLWQALEAHWPVLQPWTDRIRANLAQYERRLAAA